MRQSDIFLQGEGDRWLERNREGLGQRDPVTKMIEAIELKPENVLEIGCSNGWRLDALREKYGCRVLGIEPSRQASDEGATQLSVPIFRATAAALPVRGAAHDLVIYGFCLYLADPDDWFKIVAEGDRVLKPGGHMIIHDFSNLGEAFGRKYEHCDGITAYHLDFAQFWLANPLYNQVHRRVFFEDAMITVLQKLQLTSMEVLP